MNWVTFYDGESPMFVDADRIEALSIQRANRETYTAWIVLVEMRSGHRHQRAFRAAGATSELYCDDPDAWDAAVGAARADAEAFARSLIGPLPTDPPDPDEERF